MRKKIRYFFAFVILSLLVAAFVVWEPSQPADDADPTDPEYKLIYALEKLKEKVPDLKGELDELTEGITEKLAEAKETTSSFSFDRFNLFAGKEENIDDMSVEGLTDLLQASEEDLKQIDSAELSEKLKSIVNKVKVQSASQTTENNE